MKNRLAKFPLFFITIPAFFFLNSHNYYFGLLDWSLIWDDLLVYVSVPMVLFVLFRFVLGSWLKAAILVAWLLILFYFFYPIHRLLRSLPYVSIVVQYKILLPLILVCFIAFVYYLKKRKAAFTRHHVFLNLLFLALLFYEMAVTIHYRISGKVEAQDLADRNKQLLTSFLPCDTCLKPDIYFFIFDEYASDSILNDELNYSNAALRAYLREKGFYVVGQSRSNYNFTHLSLASELNLSYLKEMQGRSRYYTRDYLRGGYTVYRNELFKMMEKQGYRLQNFSIFDIEGHPTPVVKPFRTEQSAFLLDQTFLRRVRRDIGWNFRKAGDHALAPPGEEDIRTQDEDIKRISNTREGVMRTLGPGDSAVFVYAHFLLPHPPFYYDSNGTRLSRTASMYATSSKDYVQQLVYTNKFIIKPMVDSIFKLSSRPFIIILQGDHGYRNFPEGEELLEFYNLNAIYFHDRDYSYLYPQITSVNTFRVALNKYFNTNFPLLKDTSYYLIRNLE
jgi:hypothetical protein